MTLKTGSTSWLRTTLMRRGFRGTQLGMSPATGNRGFILSLGNLSTTLSRKMDDVHWLNGFLGGFGPIFRCHCIPDSATPLSISGFSDVQVQVKLSLWTPHPTRRVETSVTLSQVTLFTMSRKQMYCCAKHPHLHKRVYCTVQFKRDNPQLARGTICGRCGWMGRPELSIMSTRRNVHSNRTQRVRRGRNVSPR